MDGLTDPLDSFKKIDKLWFDDADLVICAGKSKFRVYRGILSTQSTILRDMLARPTGDEDKSQRNPYTVLTLQDDAKDVYYFFLAIFDPSFYHDSSSVVYPLGVTNSILRLAGKYTVPHLILRTIAHLEKIFSTLLYPFNAIFHWVDMAFDTYTRSLEGSPSTTSYLMDCIETLPLLFRAGLRWLIPSVLYIVVSRFETTAIIMNPSFPRLSSALQALIVEGIANDAMLNHSRLAWIGLLPSDNCTDEETCRQLSKAILSKLHESQPWKKTELYLSYTMMGHGFSGVDLPEECKHRELCSTCHAVASNYRDEVKEKFHNKYWTMCGFTNPQEAAKLRETTIAQLEKGVPSFVNFKFVEQSD